MKYEVTSLTPIQPMIVRYKEDEEEREDLFYFAPENGALIPAFGPGEGPKEMENFVKAFGEAFKKMMEARQSKIVRASAMPPGMPGGKGPGLIVP